jgi:hypothetical protein
MGYACTDHERKRMSHMLRMSPETGGEQKLVV